METTKFYEDIDNGLKGEEKFIELYFKTRKIDYKDVSNDPEWQVKDIDFITEDKTYEVKYNYNDDGWIFIEEYSNINPDLSTVTKGWVYKSKADILAVVSKKTDKVLLFNFVEMKKRYEEIKDKYELKKNKISTIDNRGSWQSAFRKVKLEEFKGLYIIV